MLRLVINSRFLTQPITGVQRYAHEITKALIKLGKDEVIPVAPQKIRSEFIGIYPLINSSTAISGHAWEQLVLPRYLKKLYADLLFSPGNTGPLNVGNQVVTIHDAAIFKRPEGYNKNFLKLYRLLLPHLAQSAEKIITVSNFSKAELVESLKISSEKIVTIYNGVGDNFKPQSQKAQKEFAANMGLPEKYVLVLGTRGKNKNLRRLLKAWELLTREEKMQNVFLVIAGGIENTLASDDITVLTSRLLRVHSIGYIKEAILPQLYSGAEVFVHPSLYEGFGLPPLEAMACGTPTVVSKAASLPEVVGDAGIYIDPYNIEDIARGIYKAIIDKEIQNDLSNKGLERAKLFTWEKTARETLQVFRDITEAGGRRI